MCSLSYLWFALCPELSTKLLVVIWGELCSWWWSWTRLTLLLLLVGIKFDEGYIMEVEFELEDELNPTFPSEADIFEKANKVSGKFGGVAGVFAGVHI